MSTTTIVQTTDTVYSDIMESLYVDLDAVRARFDDDVIESGDRRELETDLGRRLYERLHVRWPLGHNSLARSDRDLDVEQRIADAVHPHTVTVPESGRTDGPAGTTVDLFGARVLLAGSEIPRRVHPDEPPVIEIPDLWPALSPGFSMVFGPDRPRSSPAHALWRMYLAAEHLDDAMRSFATVVEHLRGTARRWQAKIASTAAVYPRTDAVTVYLDESEIHRLDSLRAALPRLPDLPTSRFVRHLGPGLGLAQEPDDARRRGLSFGQHRASLIARAAIERAEGRPDPLPSLLASAGVDPSEPWRNLAPAPH